MADRSAPRVQVELPDFAERGDEFDAFYGFFSHGLRTALEGGRGEPEPAMAAVKKAALEIWEYSMEAAGNYLSGAVQIAASAARRRTHARTALEDFGRYAARLCSINWHYGVVYTQYVRDDVASGGEAEKVIRLYAGLFGILKKRKGPALEESAARLKEPYDSLL